MSVARENDCPVLIHTNEPVGHIYPGKTPNTLKQIYDMIAAFPDNRIILAHWGGGLFFYSLQMVFAAFRKVESKRSCWAPIIHSSILADISKKWLAADSKNSKFGPSAEKMPVH